jgi:hypothetical protein
MNLTMLALAIVAIGLMNTGFIEWLKGAWKKVLKLDIPEWIPSILPFLLSLFFGYLLAPLIGLAGSWWIAVGFLGLAITELCYQIFIQSIPQAVAGAISSLTGGSAPSIPAPGLPVAPPGSTPSPQVVVGATVPHP